LGLHNFEYGVCELSMSVWRNSSPFVEGEAGCIRLMTRDAHCNCLQKQSQNNDSRNSKRSHFLLSTIAHARSGKRGGAQCVRKEVERRATEIALELGRNSSSRKGEICERVISKHPEQQSSTARRVMRHTHHGRRGCQRL